MRAHTRRRPSTPRPGIRLGVATAALAMASIGLLSCSSDGDSEDAAADDATSTAAASADGAASSARGLPDGFVVLSDVDADIVQEMRYAGDRNFVGRPIRGYDAPACWLTEEAANALAAAQQDARARGFDLKVYDCFRPTRAVADFVEWAQDPDAVEMRPEYYPRLAKEVLFPEGYIAETSSHSRGSTVDVTLVPSGAGASPGPGPGAALVDCATPGRAADTSIDMGTGYDCFDPLANTADPRISPQQAANRALLGEIMTEAGFTNLDLEWWHFTLDDEPFPDTTFDAAIVGVNLAASGS